MSDLCTSIPTLTPTLAARVIGSLLATVPPLADNEDPQQREARLVEEVAALGPRDLEEAMLAVQALAARYGAFRCFHAEQRYDPASREASRLRRDAVAMQRSEVAMLCALHKSQERPLLDDESGLAPRPAVPVRAPVPPRVGPAASGQHVSAARPANAPAATGTGSSGEPACTEPPAKFDPYAADPSLERLRQNWGKLKRWEEMTMEERRETFGYKYTPPEAAQGGNAPSATHAASQVR